MVSSIVPRSDLAVLWPLLWPPLERAAKRAKPAPLGQAEVRALIERGQAELWAILEDGRPIAAITTQVTLLPEKRCRIWLVGGTRMDAWAADFMATIERWAREHGCAAVYGEQTRPGWARIVDLFGGSPIDTADGIPAWGRRLA